MFFCIQNDVNVNNCFAVYNVLHILVKKNTFPGVGDGEGVSVEVVLPLEEVLRPRDDRIGVTDELPLVPLVPLVELFGDVVFDVLRNADGTVGLLKITKQNLRQNVVKYVCHFIKVNHIT